MSLDEHEEELIAQRVSAAQAIIAERSFVCPYPNCTSAYNRKGNLQAHIKQKHIAIEYRCEEPGCGKVYHRKAHLKRHRMAIHDNVEFRCVEKGCDKVFRYKHLLEEHKRVKHRIFSANRRSTARADNSGTKRKRAASNGAAAGVATTDLSAALQRNLAQRTTAVLRTYIGEGLKKGLVKESGVTPATASKKTAKRRNGASHASSATTATPASSTTTATTASAAAAVPSSSSAHATASTASTGRDGTLLSSPRAAPASRDTRNRRMGPPEPFLAAAAAVADDHDAPVVEAAEATSTASSTNTSDVPFAAIATDAAENTRNTTTIGSPYHKRLRTGEFSHDGLLSLLAAVSERNERAQSLPEEASQQLATPPVPLSLSAQDVLVNVPSATIATTMARRRRFDRAPLPVLQQNKSAAKDNNSSNNSSRSSGSADMSCDFQGQSLYDDDTYTGFQFKAAPSAPVPPVKQAEHNILNIVHPPTSSNSAAAGGVGTVRLPPLSVASLLSPKQ